MSKKLIAGAGVVASLAVALAPLATFAVVADTNVRQHTDTLNLTIPEICTLGTVTNGAADDMTDATNNTDGTGSWTDGATSATTHVGRTDTLAADVFNGQSYANLGTTTFTIRCNDADGYSLSAVAMPGTATDAVAGNLTHSGGVYTIPTAASGTLTADNGSYWNFKFSNASTGMTIAEGYNAAHAVPTTATPIVTTSAAGDTEDGQAVTVTYGAGIDIMQEAGIYDGSVQYTLAQL